MNFRRLKQILYYGWLHANQISEETKINKYKLFVDIVLCYIKYRMWSNQYLKEKFYLLSKKDRIQIGLSYLKIGKTRDKWQKDFEDNTEFFAKYGSIKYDCVKYREIRKKAYMKRYGIGEGCHIGYNVNICRNHYLPGSIKFGKNILINNNVFIDYSGHVVIEDGVKLTNGVIIESHHRDIDAYNKGKDINIQSDLLIRENAYIGSRAIILDSCHYIGKNSRIGAGAVVTKDIPDYALAVGIPAKVVKYIQSDFSLNN